MRYRPAAAWAVFLALWIALPVAARAHPHVWATSHGTLFFDGADRLTAIGVDWLFDEEYSAVATMGLDANHDGNLDAAELRPLAVDILDKLEDWHLFTYLHLDGRHREFGKLTRFGASYGKGRLSINFVMALARPVDPRRQRVAFSSFDPSFYIDIQPAKRDPVRVEGTMPPGCAARVQPPSTRKARAISDAVVPLLDVDPDDAEHSPGAQFAFWIELACTPTQAPR